MTRSFSCFVLQFKSRLVRGIANRQGNYLAVLLLFLAFNFAAPLLSLLDVMASDTRTYELNRSSDAQTVYQTYILEFNLVDISDEQFAALPEAQKKAIIDQLVDQIEEESRLKLDIRTRYQFVPSVVIFIDDDGVQQLKNHSSVKSISSNNLLKPS